MQPECRICLNTVDGDLFSPCACAGSMAHVHRQCLDAWNATRVPPRDQCSLCGCVYALEFEPTTRALILARAVAQFAAFAFAPMCSVLLLSIEFVARATNVRPELALLAPGFITLAVYILISHILRCVFCSFEIAIRTADRRSRYLANLDRVLVVICALR